MQLNELISLILLGLMPASSLKPINVYVSQNLTTSCDHVSDKVDVKHINTFLTHAWKCKELCSCFFFCNLI